METHSLEGFWNGATRFLFFTGKGGVGKTSLACATAVALADRGNRVLLVSTDPASNLDEVLETELSSEPRSVGKADGLDALNIDPEEATRAYRERIVGPIRGVLPDATVANIEEQLSGACTTEIASFNEFSRLLGDREAVSDYAYVILDTAPTGHTLRLLALPAAWSDFIAENKSGSSCLGPLSGLKDQQEVYQEALKALRDPGETTVVLVARADEASLREAARASAELSELEVRNQRLILNALFQAPDSSDPLAEAMALRTDRALAGLPQRLRDLERFDAPFVVAGLGGVAGLRAFASGKSPALPAEAKLADTGESYPDLDTLIDSIAVNGKGVVMTMGKGGVGKTSLAKRIALSLADRGLKTHLTTTDPANREWDMGGSNSANLTLSSIDPQEVTRAHVENVLATTGSKLDGEARALLEEELRSPCTEEIAVFTAFAKEVAKGADQFVILDTAPTGHTLLLLDATEAYHREVLKNTEGLSDEVRSLLPRLRNPEFTKTIIVALPEATPVHEAAQLQRDLRRAEIEPFAWILNQCISGTHTQDPLLRAKAAGEQPYIQLVSEELAERWALVPWSGEALDQPSKTAPETLPV